MWGETKIGVFSGIPIQSPIRRQGIFQGRRCVSHEGAWGWTAPTKSGRIAVNTTDSVSFVITALSGYTVNTVYIDGQAGVAVTVGVAVVVVVGVTVGNQVGQGSTGQGIGMQPPVGQVDSTVIGTDFALQP